MSTDYYKILGVEKDASDSAIKKAYRRLAKQYHPDRNKDKNDAEKKKSTIQFQKVTEAYETLSNKQKRANYDMYGHSQSGGFQSHDFGSSGSYGSQEDMRNFFYNMFGGGHNTSQEFKGGFSNFFGDIFEGSNKSASYKSRQPKSHDLETKLEITLKDLFEYDNQEITLTTYVRCSVCGGAGHSEPLTQCLDCKGRGRHINQIHNYITQTICSTCGGSGQSAPACHGCQNYSGRVTGSITAKIPLPKDIEDIATVLVKNKGAYGAGSTGNLKVVFHLKKDNVFSKKQYDLYCEHTINLKDVYNQTAQTIQSVSGEYIQFQVSAGNTFPYKKIIQGKGFPDKFGKRGDLIITVNLYVPN